jgi:hypothetical protein
MVPNNVDSSASVFMSSLIAAGSQLTNDWTNSQLSTKVGRLNCCWPLPAVIPGFGLLKIHSQDNCSLLDTYSYVAGVNATYLRSYVMSSNAAILSEAGWTTAASLVKAHEESGGVLGHSFGTPFHCPWEMSV